MQRASSAGKNRYVFLNQQSKSRDRAILDRNDSGYIYDLKLDASGNLFIAARNYAYKLTPTGKLSTVAGNGSTSTSLATEDMPPARDSAASMAWQSIAPITSISAMPITTGFAKELP